MATNVRQKLCVLVGLCVVQWTFTGIFFNSSFKSEVKFGKSVWLDESWAAVKQTLPPFYTKIISSFHETSLQIVAEVMDLFDFTEVDRANDPLLQEQKVQGGRTVERKSDAKEKKETTTQKETLEEQFFAASRIPRSPRSDKIRFHVGQVIKHKLWGYRAVIVGWDEYCKAPEPWIAQMHSHAKGFSAEEWRNMPNYSVLVDVRDRPGPQTTYIPQVNIIPLSTNEPVAHPDVIKLFESSVPQHGCYHPQEHLRRMYPHDNKCA